MDTVVVVTLLILLVLIVYLVIANSKDSGGTVDPAAPSVEMFEPVRRRAMPPDPNELFQPMRRPPAKPPPANVTPAQLGAFEIVARTQANCAVCFITGMPLGNCTCGKHPKGKAR